MSNYIYTNEGLVNADELMHYGVPGMRWGRRKSSYVYAYGQNPKNGYQKAMRSLGGTKFAKKAIANSKLSSSQKRKALEEQELLADEKAYNKAKKKAAKTGGQMTYDTATKKYSVTVSTDGSKKRAAETARQQMIDAKRSKDSAQIKASKTAYKVAKKMANVEAKEVKKMYRKEYMKGSNIAGKIYAKYTGSHKLYADMMYDINNGAYKSSNPTSKLAKKVAESEAGARTQKRIDDMKRRTPKR